MEDVEEFQIYVVVFNNDGQYSIWPKHKPVPLGWYCAGVEGARTDCLQYIETVWTDMRPLSIGSATYQSPDLKGRKGKLFRPPPPIEGAAAEY